MVAAIQHKTRQLLGLIVWKRCCADVSGPAFVPMLLCSITGLWGPLLRETNQNHQREQKTLTPTTANFHNLRLRLLVKRSVGTPVMY